MKYAIRILLILAGALIGASSTIAAEPAAPEQNHQATAADSTGAIAAQRARWTAFIVGDVRHLEAFTAPSL